jgi:hypothetical protein
MSTIRRAIALSALFFCAQINAAELSIMGDVTYQDGSPIEEKGGFALGQIDLFASQEISEDTRALLEVVIEDKNGFGVDAERLEIEKHFRDELNIAAGRFHTPIGFYNANYHHGTLMQFTAQRPFFLDFEDGALAILPTHIVGLMASGKHAFGGLDAGYQIGLGNGSSIDTDKAATDREIEMNNSGDNNSSKASVLHLSLTDPALGLSGGLSYMTNKVAESGDLLTYGVAKGETLNDQTISALDLQYQSRHINFSAEVFHIINKTRVPGSEVNDHADAWFAEVSTPITDKDRIGYRYESLDINHADFYFNTILPRNSADQHVLTYRHDFDDSNAVKLEYRKFTTSGGNPSDYFVVQWAFMIP